MSREYIFLQNFKNLSTKHIINNVSEGIIPKKGARTFRRDIHRTNDKDLGKPRNPSKY